MANTSTLAEENKTESNLDKFELSRSGRKKNPKSEASNKQRRWRENGGFVVEQGQELYQHPKCNVKKTATQQPKRTQYESYQYRLNAISARAS
jgi:hypothetical protein